MRDRRPVPPLLCKQPSGPIQGARRDSGPIGAGRNFRRSGEQRQPQQRAPERDKSPFGADPAQAFDLQLDRLLPRRRRRQAFCRRLSPSSAPFSKHPAERGDKRQFLLPPGCCVSPRRQLRGPDDNPTNGGEQARRRSRKCRRWRRSSTCWPNTSRISRSRTRMRRARCNAAAAAADQHPDQRQRQAARGDRFRGRAQDRGQGRCRRHDAVQLRPVYAGVFRVQNVPQENIHPLIMIECPRLLFPFAREIIATAVRNGGFPPLLIDPVDFVGFTGRKWRRRRPAARGRARASLPHPACASAPLRSARYSCQIGRLARASRRRRDALAARRRVTRGASAMAVRAPP